MNSSEQQKLSWKSRLFSYVAKNWIFSILAVALIIVFLTIWNGRYDAGYKAGAGEGSVYKPLYEQTQTRIRDLRNQHDKDTNENAALKKRNGQLEGKVGLFKPNVTQNQAEELKNQLSQDKAKFDQERAETFSQSVEIGKTYGRLEEYEKINQELSNEIDRARGGIQVRDFIILALLTAGCLLAWFSPRKNNLPENYSLYSNQKSIPTSIPISAIIADSSNNIRSLEDDKMNQKALPADQQNDGTDSTNDGSL